MPLRRDECHDELIMKPVPPRFSSLRPHAPSWLLRGVVAALATVMSGITFESQQRKWIFQAGLRPEVASEQQTTDLSDHWIDYDSKETGTPVRLNCQWLAQPRADAPVLLYLHGARWDLRGSTQRMQQFHQLGFAVLGIDYRGFGRSTPALPSERMACEDAQAAWRWLAQQHPQAQRYVYGHSLGAAIAVHLMTEVDDAAGLIVEGAFTSIPDLFETMRWGWLPLTSLITQRFDAAERVPRVRVPLLVVHGSEDELIRPAMGRALFERATAPKRFLLVEGGSHHDTHVVGLAQYREALHELFGLVV
jgi:alpha-beta hydrolase superfamily lysophospholipase